MSKNQHFPLNKEAKVPVIKCIYHPEQTVTNFCDSSECMHPLCPVCVAHHINEHKNYRDYAQFKTYDQVLGEVNTEINQFLKSLKNHKDQVSSLEEGYYRNEKNLRTQLSQAHTKAKVLLDEYFRALNSELEASIKVSKNRFENEKLRVNQRLNERAEINVNYANGLYDKEKSARSLMTYLHSDVRGKNEKFIKSLTDLSEFQGLSVKVDTSKLQEIHLLLSKYVEVQNQSIISAVPQSQQFIERSHQIQQQQQRQQYDQGHLQNQQSRNDLLGSQNHTQFVSRPTQLVQSRNYSQPIIQQPIQQYQTVYQQQQPIVSRLTSPVRIQQQIPQYQSRVLVSPQHPPVVYEQRQQQPQQQYLQQQQQPQQYQQEQYYNNNKLQHQQLQQEQQEYYPEQEWNQQQRLEMQQQDLQRVPTFQGRGFQDFEQTVPRYY
ncbi:hypothetical protein PPERSA_05453 [Pseudocohnilembus persalinus]|uniref:B box-type domain-containing protein n=1 Tax=Pseudocohnilembus persalinus TaxID=266149 RepID=A0A0V0R809_PSEPJ|nr:hypothetical protein PPERSA_05453 [Pseudocohnilembus persalinus]|eukprot:KRX10633.1 hypothetical protein PPERSA_05453 [Pseudocohnilembus persalinus]